METRKRSEPSTSPVDTHSKLFYSFSFHSFIHSFILFHNDGIGPKERSIHHRIESNRIESKNKICKQGKEEEKRQNEAKRKGVSLKEIDACRVIVRSRHNHPSVAAVLVLVCEWEKGKGKEKGEKQTARCRGQGQAFGVESTISHTGTICSPTDGRFRLLLSCR